MESFRQQMAQSMKELQSIIDNGEGVDGGGRFTARTVQVVKPSAYAPGTIRAYRQSIGVSQAVFAQLLGVSQVLIRSWESGARKPAPIARRLLDILQQNPDAFTGLLEATASRSGSAANKRQLRRSAGAKRDHRATAA
jgi:DNA-binding transcriptional regulator YiaG